MSRNIEIAFDAMDYYHIGEAIKYKKLFKYASKYELIDRLYRRYVKYADIETTQKLVEKIFRDISFDCVLRSNFMDAYDRCVNNARRYSGDDAKHYGADGNYCRPIRIVNVTGIDTDTEQIPQYMAYISAESEIPLEDYDNLEGNPFWMRPEYVVEKYL